MTTENEVEKPTEKTWQQEIEFVAQAFSQVVESRFIGSVMRAESFLPKVVINQETREENRVRLLETFIDYTMGTVVAMLAHYASSQPEFEEALVAITREKFVRIRKLKEEGKIQ